MRQERLFFGTGTTGVDGAWKAQWEATDSADAAANLIAGETAKAKANIDEDQILGKCTR